MADEIIKELWKVKDTIAREYEYDLDALIDHIKTIQKSKKHQVVDLYALRKTKKPKPEFNKIKV